MDIYTTSRHRSTFHLTAYRTRKKSCGHAAKKSILMIKRVALLIILCLIFSGCASSLKGPAQVDIKITEPNGHIEPLPKSQE